MLPRKIVEHFFKLLPVLILLPIFIVVPTFLMLSSAPAEFESRATLWVSETGTTGGIDVLGAENVYASPSQRQAQSIAQLLATDSFALDVARGGGVLADTPDRDVDWRTVDYVSQEAEAISLVRKSVWSSSDGTNLMSITARAKDPQRAYAMVNAATNLYLERIATEASRKTDLVVSFYQQRLENSITGLDEIDRQITDYVAKHPSVTQFNSFDPAFTRLRAAFDSQNQLVTKMRESLELAQLDATTANEGQKGRYSLVDAPVVPALAVKQGLKSRAMSLVLALGGAVGLVAGLLYLSFVTDHTVRSSEDIATAGVPVLAFLPELDSRQHGLWVLRPLLRRDQAFARKLAANLAAGVQLERGA